MAFTKIQTVSVTGSPNAVEFTAIPNTYKDLYILLNIRNSGAGGREGVIMTFNNSTSGYSRSRGFLYDTGPSIVADSGTSQSSIAVGFGNSTAVGANYFSPLEFHIFSYASSVANKTAIGRYSQVSNSSSSFLVGFGHYGWANSSAISSIKFNWSADNFVAGSTATLYGIS